MPLCLPSSAGIQRSYFPHWGGRQGSDGPIGAGSVSGRWRPKGAAGGVCPRQTDSAVDGQTDPLGSGSSAAPPGNLARLRVTFSRFWLGGLLLPSGAVGQLGLGSHDTGRLGARWQEKQR